MSRASYKTALRAKGIKPIPPYKKLRSSKVGDQCITASDPKRFVPYRGPARRCVAHGDWYCNHDDLCPLTELGL